MPTVIAMIFELTCNVSLRKTLGEDVVQLCRKDAAKSFK